MEYSEQFKTHCLNLAKEYNIKIINKNEWYKSIWQKGWNQYYLLYKLYKNLNYQSITSETLITLYKANIRLRNVLYQLSLFIEECFKSWLHFNNLDENNSLNNKMIGNLLKDSKITQKVKMNFLNREKEKINDNNYELMNHSFKSWNEIRNSVCHRKLKMWLEEEDLFKKINQMLNLLEISQRNSFITQIIKSLEHIPNFIESKWGRKIECLLEK